MTFENVPAELRALPQWVVWKYQVSGEGRRAKPPHRLDNPTIGASVHDPSGWGTFEQALACWAANPSTIDGVGFMLTEQDPYVVLDLDDRGKLTGDHLELRKAFEAAVLGLGTYTEESPSGTGLHAWARAVTGVAGKHVKKLASEAYAWDRFITVTGKRYGSATQILNCQSFVDTLGLGEEAPTGDVLDDYNKETGLTDQVVVERARAFVSWFSERWDGRAGCGQHEWYKTYNSIVQILDKLTGSVSQIQRLVYNSPMVLQSQPAANGETRARKARRTFLRVMANNRAWNGGDGYFREHGRAVWAAICAERERQAQLVAEKVRAAQEELGQLSAKASSLLDYFPMLEDAEHRLLSHPPGVTGEFVRATEAASHAPYLKFAVPATLAALAGVLGRAYKTQSGGGINLNFILAAPSATGKTQTMHAWNWFMSEAVATMPATGNGPAKSRILTTSTSSIQGIMTKFEDMPSIAWFNEECQSQLASMSGAKGAVETALRDAYNQLYDCAKHGHLFSPPLSVASRNANIQPINNLSVSTYWTTTTSKFDVFSDDALDGFLSRVVIIRHQGPAGALQREVRGLDARLVALLAERMSIAEIVDGLYKGAAGGAGAQAAQQLVRVDQSLVQDLDWELVLRCENIKNASLRGELPPTYTSASRLPQTAMRVAVVLAAMENPYAPQVTPIQLKWAFGYLLQNTVALLSDMDRGEVGAQQGDDFAAVARGYAVLAKGGKYASMPGIPRGELTALLKTYKPFTSNVTLGRSKAVTNTLDHMLKEGLVEEVCPPAVGRGRPTKYIVPVLGNELWGSIRAA